MIAGRKVQSSSLSGQLRVYHPLHSLFKKLATISTLQRQHFLNHQLKYYLDPIIMATHHERGPRQQPEASKQPLKKRAVVSSFIFKFPEDGKGKPVVALFRRSDKVNTYQHCLAPISGSIDISDTNPVATAWREIQEETKLLPSSLTLFRQGKPYSFSDPSIGREWTIYPFGFLLKSKAEGGQGEEGIQTDWEHEGWEWYDPDDVVDREEFGGVPRLKESLRRVWFEGDIGEQAGRVLAAGLHRLQTDHESGSRELAGFALGVLKDVIAEMGEDVTDSGWWEKVRMAGWHLWKNGRESMGAAILNVVISALTAIEAIRLESGGEGSKRDRILAAVDGLIAKRKSTTARINEAFTSYLRTNFVSTNESKSTVTILTLSSSSTIRTCLLHACRYLDMQTLDLRILESRPLCEGVSTASSILSELKSQSQARSIPKVQMAIYTDSSAALASANLDIVLLGADRIATSGDVSNKAGSLPAVLSAKRASPAAKTVVLSELEKVSEPDGAGSQAAEESDPAEVIRGWRGEGVKGVDVVEQALAEVRDSTPPKADEQASVTLEVKNIYFEWTPSELVDAYVCEEGVWNVSNIRERSMWVGKQVERLFGGL